ncbi:MAG: UDP-N-acetylglucosamine 2-epimerase (non-hydrolyzing) [Desulfobacterales bacterium]|nr:UDP-N-acetylglucosamine 2-epimerase (non-hydrolyzing) [Desulfobacterales bacterium]
MKIFLIAGARPNFMKIAPIARELEKNKDIKYRIIHTGQHYDQNMSYVFFEELGIKNPDYHLKDCSGTTTQQTARIMIEFEAICKSERPDLVIVVGDVNSTLACSIVAKKLNLKLAHVEAGLRSFDLTMPEEINRMVTDSISDIFFVTEEEGLVNLRKEGKSKKDIHFVGNVMIDSLYYQLSKINKKTSDVLKFDEYKIKNPEYGVITLHRASNVDDKQTLVKIYESLQKISEKLPLIFSIHPRTRKNMEKYGINTPEKIKIVEPLSYMEFLNLWKDAKVVLTDSGGLQEETTALGVPCLTIRNNTERPITISKGTNQLVGTSNRKIQDAFRKIMENDWKSGEKPELWDGKAAERIVSIILNEYF